MNQGDHSLELGQCQPSNNVVVGRFSHVHDGKLHHLRFLLRMLPDGDHEASKNRMSKELMVFTNIRPTSKFSITGVITNGSLWAHFIPSKSFLEYDRSGNSGRAPVVTTKISLLAYARLALPNLLRRSVPLK
ncbi:hypothetical protein LIER_26767 [Lithospermum erythrorhizon]|uniref:Uncharacterized protein n=1 Tax=Lithospermum erythrorhizon TaxID=34254 RepID=A0AAV3R9J9_LITER